VRENLVFDSLIYLDETSFEMLTDDADLTCKVNDCSRDEDQHDHHMLTI